MIKREKPMLRKYWENIGGTLIEEFLAVSASSSCGKRLIDGVIIQNGEHRLARRNEVSLSGKDIIVVQVKAERLGMNLMGQTLFSAELMKQYNPASICSVALCSKDDSVLRPLLESYPNTTVVVLDSLVL